MDSTHDYPDNILGYFRIDRDGLPRLVGKPEPTTPLFGPRPSATPGTADLANLPHVADSAAYELTDAGRQALDTPVSDEEPVAWVAVRGWCEVCSRALPWKAEWPEPLCPDCVVVVPTGKPVEVTATPDSAAEPQRYDDCDCCGGPFAFGPSLHPTCAMCSEGEEQAAAAYESSCPVDLVTDTDDQTTARVLRSAAVYLERHGWIQGAYYDATSGVFTPPADMVGALGMVCYGGPCDAPAQHFSDPGFLDFEAAVLHLDRYLLAENSSVAYEFNDAKGRCLEDVTHVLRDAANRPAHELIDALRVIDQHNADLAAISAAFTPGGVFAEGDTDGGDA